MERGGNGTFTTDGVLSCHFILGRVLSESLSIFRADDSVLHETQGWKGECTGR